MHELPDGTSGSDSGAFDTERLDRTEVAQRAARASRSPMRDRGTLLMVGGPSAGMVCPLSDKETVIGRDFDVGCIVDDPGVSRRHARIFRDKGAFFIEDLDSGNGTYAGGVAVRDEPRQLHDGDRIQLGKNVLFRFDTHDRIEQQVLLELYQSAVRDPLTHAHNRRYLDERLHGELSYAVRHYSELSVILLDIDHFKQINDEYGHRAGDSVLRIIAHLMQRMMRPEDVLARYGGEEFCIVGRGLDSSNALILAERIRRAIEGLEIPWSGHTLRITVSLGIGSVHHETPPQSAAELMAVADNALYRAKDQGRNRSAL